MYSYDLCGWLSEVTIPGRQTDVVPMAAEGVMQPNFTGYVWLLQKYVEPPIPKSPEDLASIKAEIATLDFRRIRPLAEGDTEYLAALNNQIAALRVQLQ